MFHALEMNIPEVKYKVNVNDQVKNYTIDNDRALQDKNSRFHATVFSIPPKKIRKPLIF